MARVCPIKRCETPPMESQLMCRRHWEMVPVTLQRRVWAAYRGLRIKRNKVEAVEEYHAAKCDAIAAVELQIDVRRSVAEKEQRS